MRLNGASLPVYGNGSNVRDWLFVEDHVRALFSVATAGRVGANVLHRRSQREDEP